MLDRLEIEDAGPDPKKIALEILLQLDFPSKAIDLVEIARALDILEVRFEPLRNFEGALITDRVKNKGSILVNSRASLQRRRFTIAHELGHFLNFQHVGNQIDGFLCNQSDLRSTVIDSNNPPNRFAKQEVEANRFACELLMPGGLIKSKFYEFGDLEQILELAKTLKVSKQAMARRYVELHKVAMSIVYSRDGNMTYSIDGGGMPHLKIREGDRLPHLDLPNFGMEQYSGAEIDPSLWLHNPEEVLICEHFNQANGYAMTLLQIYN